MSDGGRTPADIAKRLAALMATTERNQSGFAEHRKSSRSVKLVLAFIT